MEYNETSSISSEINEVPNNKNGQHFQADVAKFYATIATVSRNMRKDDWTYLQRHPEIRAIIRVITTEAIKANPSNIHQFSAKLFDATNEKELIEKINNQLKLVNEQMRGGTWSKADGVMIFPESSENSSENSNSCPPTTLNATKKMDENVKLVCPENYQPSCK